MCASTVSLPVADTRIVTRPSPLMLPPVSLSLADFSTGSGSPESIDSSTWVLPSSSAPSAGKRSPGRTTSVSPTMSSATGTSDSSPARFNTWATSGRNACRARIAAVVCRLARASNHLPSSTSVTTTAEPSKYKCTITSGSALSHNHIDKHQPAVVPIATSRSMFPENALSALQPAL